jgi:hypothetical protein
MRKLFLWRTRTPPLSKVYPNQGIVTSIEVEEILKAELPNHVSEFLQVVRDVVWNRRTFVGEKALTKDKIVGLIPRTAQVGDIICILLGCSVPVVLRRYKISVTTIEWRLSGDAYVHGIMDGEAICSLSEDDRRQFEKEFNIR